MGLFDFFKKGKAEKVAEEIKEAAEQIADAVEDAVEDIAEVVSGEEEAAPESTGNALMDMIYGGSDAVIMRHPAAIRTIAKMINALM